VVSATALLQPDRRALGSAGGALLAAASWVRLWDLGVTAPEAYTLPSAFVLLLVGLDRLRRDRSTSTMGTLAPGLSLVLAPSLLWVLAEPTGLRPLLLGLGCLVLVLAGARLGWTAPIALGAAAGALLVLRLAAPYVGDAVPRWVLLGAAGALLIAVGATWERRLADARSVVTYVRALR
jgi:cell division protein FtsW (lipid II flippase)